MFVSAAIVVGIAAIGLMFLLHALDKQDERAREQFYARTKNEGVR